MSETSDRLQRLWFIGFAGHRAVPDRPAAKAAIRRELDLIATTVHGQLVGIASAAAGADLLFLDACKEAGIRTVVLLPFPKERFSEDFDDPEEWRHSCQRMEDAWWLEVSPGGESAPAAYHVVAREVLEISERMLFLWNGQPARGLGGTAESVREARDRGIASRVIDAATLQATWNGPVPEPGMSDPSFEEMPQVSSVGELFEKLDARATLNAPKSRRFAAGSMSLNHLAGLVQALAVTFAAVAAEAGALIKFILVAVAAWLPWVGGRLRWQEQWVRDRVRAELLRSLIASHDPGSPLRPPALELFGREEAFLRSSAMHLVKCRKGWESARDAYLTERVDGQIGYLKGKGDLAAKRMAVFGKLFLVASVGAMILGGVAVVMAFLKLPLPGWLAFSAAVMPGFAAWLLAMISVFEFKRRANLYHQLVDELKRLRPKVAAAQCASAVSQAMNQIERLLLNELWEWQGSRKK